MNIIVGMSGGVDSTFCMYLLKEAGYIVYGISARLLSLSLEGESRCCSLRDVLIAESVCFKLNCSYSTIDFRNTFERRVVRPFFMFYKFGKTPNPCVFCNKFIKFGLLLKKAILDNCLFSTGHFSSLKRIGRKNILFQDILDSKKNQNYFLYVVSSFLFKYIKFPIKFFFKEEIIYLVGKNDLIDKKIKNSTEICFIPKGNKYFEFIEKKKLMSIVEDIFGNFLFLGSPYYYYTIGQKSRRVKINMYVYFIFKVDNRVILCSLDFLYSNILLVSKLNFFLKLKFWPKNINLKIRFNGINYTACWSKIREVNVLFLYFLIPFRRTAIGQHVLISFEKLVLAGGEIVDIM